MANVRPTTEGAISLVLLMIDHRHFCMLQVYFSLINFDIFIKIEQTVLAPKNIRPTTEGAISPDLLKIYNRNFSMLQVFISLINCVIFIKIKLTIFTPWVHHSRYDISINNTARTLLFCNFQVLMICLIFMETKIATFYPFCISYRDIAPREVDHCRDFTFFKQIIVKYL